MDGIQQMFHELSGYEEYQLDLFSYLLRKRQRIEDAQRRYETKPEAIEKRRARQRAYWRRKHPLRASATAKRGPYIKVDGWHVIAHDVAGCIASWHGPVRWAVAVAVARHLDGLDHIKRTRVTRGRPVGCYGEPDPLPISVVPGRSVYINPGHPRRAA